MKTVDTLTDQDVISQLLAVDHATEAKSKNKFLSIDHTQANLSEQLKETEPTSFGGNLFSVVNISPLERQALQDLYNSADGPNWKNYGGTIITWNFFNPDVNPCDEGWYGIECSADYHVTTIVLSGENLRGTIPSTIGQLSSLIRLYLHINQLTGTIPSTIGQLSSLLHLELSRNQLIGTIPSTIGQLTSLDYLWLHNNQLIGSIPSNIGQLSSLNILYLSNNQLTGTIPSTIGQLFSLWYLELNGNQLTGVVPASLCQLPLLYYMSILNNPLQCYPECLSQMALDLDATPSTTLVSTVPSSRPSTAPSSRSTTAPSSRSTTTPSSRPSTVPSSRSTTTPSSRPSTTPSSRPTAVSSSGTTSAPYDLPSCPAGWTLHCGCQWSPPSSPRRFLQSAIDGVMMHMQDYDRFAVGFMACLMMVMMLYFCMYAVGKVQRAYLVETTTTP
jgi:hypothetical protein